MSEEERVYAFSLSKAVESLKNAKGIFLTDIPKGSVVEVQTQNSVYEIAVVDSTEGKVAIRGNNEFFIKPEICYLSGSTWGWGGSCIRSRWIGIDMHLELLQIDPFRFDDVRVTVRITTSPIQRIEIKEDSETAEKLIKLAKPTIH